MSHAHTAPNLPRDGPFARTGRLTVAQKSKPAPIRPTPKRSTQQMCIRDSYILCLNKRDLIERLEEGELPDAPVVRLCARTGEGVEELLARLAERLRAGGGEEECFTVERQLRLAREAAALLRDCARALGEGFSPDVAAPDILKACELLDNVTGRDASEEVISAIFANFCVGK